MDLHGLRPADWIPSVPVHSVSFVVRLNWMLVGSSRASKSRRSQGPSTLNMRVPVVNAGADGATNPSKDFSPADVLFPEGLTRPPART